MLAREFKHLPLYKKCQRLNAISQTTKTKRQNRIMSATTTGSCKHDLLAQTILDELFPPEQTWLINRHQGGESSSYATMCRWMNPAQIRDGIRRVMQNYRWENENSTENALFGRNNIELILTTSRQRETVDPYGTTPEDDLSIANELLYALLRIMANQRPPYREPSSEGEANDGSNCGNGREQPPMNHDVMCEHRKPVFITVYFSSCYCYHTVYWLCEILSSICKEFTFYCKQPFPRPRRVDASKLLLRPTDEHKRNYRKASRIIQRHFAKLREHVSSPRCQICVYSIFMRLNGLLDRLFVSRNSIEMTLISAYFIRLYRKSIIACTTQDTCANHYYDNRTTITCNVAVHMNEENFGYQSPQPECRDASIRQLCAFMNTMAFMLPGCDMRDVMHLFANNGNLSQSFFGMLFFVASLIGEPLLLNFSYKMECEDAK